MVDNFLRGGAAINVLARSGGIDVKVVDAGVDADLSDQRWANSIKVIRGTANFALGPAMTPQVAEACIVSGVTLARSARSVGIDLIGIGEMGIGNTTAASAITVALTGKSAESVTGRGTGIDDLHLAQKVETIRRALISTSQTPATRSIYSPRSEARK